MKKFTRGGYRIKTELKDDLLDMRRAAEISESIALVSGLGEVDKGGIVANTNKIIRLVDRWVE